MKNKKILIGVILVIIVIAGYLFKTDFFLSEDQKEEKHTKEQIKQVDKSEFIKLPRLTFDELDTKIKNGDDFIAYYGWIYNCGDSRLFQINSFDKYLKENKIKGKTFIIDLDVEAPEALSEKSLRAPISKRFLIDTWTKDDSLNPMELKGPQIIHYKDGKVTDLVSWTIINGDAKYGIKQELTDIFFDKLK